MSKKQFPEQLRPFKVNDNIFGFIDVIAFAVKEGYISGQDGINIIKFRCGVKK